jgi:hypothetical protein
LGRDSGDRAFDLTGIVDSLRHQLNPQFRCGRFGFVPERKMGGGLGMKEGGSMINVGRELLERLEPLAAHRKLEVGEARDIAAGPR